MNNRALTRKEISLEEFDKLYHDIKTIAYAAGLREDKQTQAIIAGLDEFYVVVDRLQQLATTGAVEGVENTLRLLCDSNLLHRLYQRILTVNHSNSQMREAPDMLLRIKQVWNNVAHAAVIEGYKASNHADSEASWWELCSRTKYNELFKELLDAFIYRDAVKNKNTMSQFFAGLFNWQSSNPSDEYPDLKMPLEYKSYEALRQNYLRELLYNPLYQTYLGGTQEGWITLMSLCESLRKKEEDFKLLFKMCMEKGDYRAIVNNMRMLQNEYNHYLDLYRGLVLADCRKQFAENDAGSFRSLLRSNQVSQTVTHLMELMNSHISDIILESLAFMLSTHLDLEAKAKWQTLVGDAKATLQKQGVLDEWHGADDINHMISSVDDPELLAKLIKNYALVIGRLQKLGLGFFDQPAVENHQAIEINRRFSI